MRVRTNPQGEAYSLIVDFDTPFITRPKNNYTLSMYTLVNCPKVGCESAQDTISVQIKEGVSGMYKEIYVVKGRVRDDRWKMEKLNFVASQSVLYVGFIPRLCRFTLSNRKFFNNVDEISVFEICKSRKRWCWIILC